MVKLLLTLIFFAAITKYIDAIACSNVRCKDPKLVAEECISRRYAFVPADGVSNCCGLCRPVRSVISSYFLRKCDPTICPRAFCIDANVSECLHGNVYVPADGKCFCCNSCVKRTRFYWY